MKKERPVGAARSTHLSPLTAAHVEICLAFIEQIKKRERGDMLEPLRGKMDVHKKLDTGFYNSYHFTSKHHFAHRHLPDKGR